MKELTIEQKAKAYDRALEIAKAWCKLDNNDLSNDDLKTIFPELKESEDGKIRKELLEIFKENKGSIYISLTPHKKRFLISLLEKQGKQKPIMIQWQGNNLKEVIDFTGKDKNFEKWFKSFEDYEKYVDDHNGIFKLFNADGSHYEVPIGSWIVKTPDGYNVASKAFFRQKNAWSEEDELIINKILCICSDFERSFEISSLSTKVIKEDVDKIDNWLKSLRPQKQWKPSKEQMLALKEAEGIVGCLTIIGEQLKSLYQDLKKL